MPRMRYTCIGDPSTIAPLIGTTSQQPIVPKEERYRRHCQLSKGIQRLTLKSEIGSRETTMLVGRDRRDLSRVDWAKHRNRKAPVYSPSHHYPPPANGFSCGWLTFVRHRLFCSGLTIFNRFDKFKYQKALQCALRCTRNSLSSRLNIPLINPLHIWSCPRGWCSGFPVLWILIPYILFAVYSAVLGKAWVCSKRGKQTGMWGVFIIDFFLIEFQSIGRRFLRWFIVPPVAGGCYRWAVTAYYLVFDWDIHLRRRTAVR